MVFDEFYKSVQAAHLLLLNSKYKSHEVETVEIKTEMIVGTDADILSTDDVTVDNTTCDYGAFDHEDDQNAIEKRNSNGTNLFHQKKSEKMPKSINCFLLQISNHRQKNRIWYQKNKILRKLAEGERQHQRDVCLKWSHRPKRSVIHRKNWKWRPKWPIIFK